MRRMLCIAVLLATVSGCSVHYHYDTVKNCPDKLLEDVREKLVCPKP